MFRLLALASAASGLVARNVKVDGQKFVLASTGEEIVLSGPNVVVKGPPWLPSVSGTTVCRDGVNDTCAAAGTCESCTTFNQADVDNIKANGWNAIRLSVIWAGAQPAAGDALDADFLARLDAILDLTDANGLHVLLDNHGDMVGTAGCGNGLPMWVQQAAAPDKIGKPLETDFPYSWVSGMDIADQDGYKTCGDDASKWAEFAGDPLYNLKNPCCQAMNAGGNPGYLGYTSLQQDSMAYVLGEGAGRDAFANFWGLVAAAVADHPSAFGAELMNEPMSVHRRDMFNAWKACAEAIHAVVPDMAVALADVGEAAVLPDWVDKYVTAGLDIDSATTDWIKAADYLFYAFHWYGTPSDMHDAVDRVNDIKADWDVPAFSTESGKSCDYRDLLRNNSISWTYWHYSDYCTTGATFGNRPVNETFGACILGWGSGSPGPVCP